MSRLTALLRFLSFWLFWPGVILIVWGELTPNPPELGGMFDWDKLEHFTAYFGLASMVTMIIGLRPRLFPTILDVILLSGLLELLQSFTGRDPEILDFAANSTGALCGLAVGAVVWRLTGLAGQRALD
jgi:VanZ family protein